MMHLTGILKLEIMVEHRWVKIEEMSKLSVNLIVQAHRK